MATMEGLFDNAHLSQSHVMTDDLERWLVDHAGGIINDPDLWPYSDQADDLRDRFNRENNVDFSHFAIFKRMIKIRDDRTRAGLGKILTKYDRTDNTYKPLPASACDLMRDLYVEIGKGEPVQGWPYTIMFDTLYKHFAVWDGVKYSKHDVWGTLMKMKKDGEDDGGLPRQRRAKLSIPDNFPLADEFNA